MFTMRLDLSLCGMCNCGAPVLLVGVFPNEVSYITAGVLCYMHCVCGCLFYPCAGVLCAVVCVPLLVGCVLVGKSLSVVLRLGGSLSFCRLGGVLVGLFVWLLEFQQGIKYFVGGYVRIVI